MIYDVVDSMLRQQEYLGNSNLCFHIIWSDLFPNVLNKF